jgi:bifunctional non-homologous end joining protein LigD
VKSTTDTGLRHYRAKRNFHKTAEPKGRLVSSKKKIFVIQEHHASHLHYDFRLELDGVLKSWSVPKGPSLDPGTKRLAVQVEDHPISYANFEGEIPKGQYGGGQVLIWDRGEWLAPEHAAQALHKGRLEFTLKGKKLHGRWILIRLNKTIHDRQPSWLLIKRHDEWAKSDSSLDIVQELPESVISSQTYKTFGTSKRKATPKKKLDKFPGFIDPQLAQLEAAPPKGSEWIREIKFDGYRAISYLQNHKVEIKTRTGLDWTKKYPFIATELRKLRVKNAIIDGEIVFKKQNRLGGFQDLQMAMKSKTNVNLVYYAFDLLFLNGRDLRSEPLLERKRVLQALIESTGSEKLLFSDHWQTSGRKLLRASCQMHLEGIVSKKIDAPYVSARSDTWVKSKCTSAQEFVIGGYTDPQGERKGFGALLLGAYEADGRLRYVGKVGTGFNELLLRDLTTRLKKLSVETSPFEIKSPCENKAHWVKPALVANIDFTQKTNGGLLRHPSFQGLREDKPAQEVVIEKPGKPRKSGKPRQTKSLKKPKDGRAVFSHPDRIFFPESGLTKTDVADYYAAVREWMLPHLVKRPLAALRCPDGVGKSCFFQKHLDLSTETGVESGKDFFFVKNFRGLTELVQIGVLEVHARGCHIQKIDRPDLLVLDLDPDPSVKFGKTREAAFELREILSLIGLESFVKVTGGKGLHIHVPVKPIYSWEMIGNFAKTIALKLVKEKPHLYTAQMSKAKRTGKIFLDYLRNREGATAIVPYSLRAKANASLALPVSWKELEKIDHADTFTLRDASRVLRGRKDPWSKYFEVKQSIDILDGLGASSGR